MARTKKQTLENASERKRQIQEEIRRETLAAKEKKENLWSLARENHSAGNTNPPHNGVGGSGASNANFRAGIHHEKMDNRGGVFSISVINSVGPSHSSGVMSQANMSTQTTDEVPPSLSDGGLPKVIICIPDICRSPAKGQEESGKISSDAHCVKQGDDSLRKKYGSSKQLEKCSLSEEVLASLKSLKAASEKVREEKSRKARHDSPSLSRSTSSFLMPNQGRRSPRQHSPPSCDSPQSSSKKGQKDPRSFSDEKPKVNIFTDTLGIDLGKRIRSPRRLSEDMIALPIFSARRWSSSPKENCAASYACGKAAEEVSVADGLETLHLHANPSCEFFSTSYVSTTSSVQSNSCESPKKSLSSSAGSSRDALSDDQLPNTGSKSSDGSVLLHRNHSLKADEHSSVMEVKSAHFDCVKAEPHQPEAENSPEEKSLKSYTLRNSKTPGSRELHLNCEGSSLAKLNQKLDDSDNDKDQPAFDGAANNASVVHNIDSPLECKKTVKSPGIKIKKLKHSTKVDVEELMSSICREIMTGAAVVKQEDEVVNDAAVFEKSYSEMDGNFQHHLSQDKAAAKDLININSSNNNFQMVSIETGSVIATSLNPVVENPDSTAEVTEEKPQSSLLCAMLVGGTEVADSYSQERVRIKPQAPETSHAELDMALGSCQYEEAVLLLPQTLPLSVDLKKSESSTQLDKQDFGEDKISIISKDIDSFGHVLTRDSTACVKTEDVNDKISENTLSSIDKKGGINLSSQLKKLNESVLKLMEIDLEEEFLKDLETDESGIEECSESQTPGTVLKDESMETSLYGLISALGSRLRVTNSQIPCSTPVDMELVEKLMQSCPKTSPSIIPKLKTLARMSRIYRRLKEEELKETGQFQGETNVEKPLTSADSTQGSNQVDEFQNSSDATKNVQSFSEKAFLQMVDKELLHVADDCETVNENTFEEGSVAQEDSDAISDSMHIQMSGVASTFSDVADSVSGACLNDSLCDPVLDSRVSTVDSEADVEGIKEKDSEQISNLKSSPCDNEEMLNCSPNEVLEMPSRQSFKKSKTCDDSLFSTPSSHARTLRRVNSSPQINAKISLQSTSPTSPVTSSIRENHTKSKLGSKIPIPGTSYTTKLKKSWRTPRTIVEPKPLSVLSELEKKSSPSSSIFSCQNLQKYLSIPSNRVIVAPDMREEMEILDAKAKEEEEMREKMMQDKEDRDKKSEEEINLDYKKYEPDFDEVDGMLFMSFSSEVELQAHVRVEKALEWDRDDTMLRVSRAKAFEEAKIHNEDMGHFKLKHLRGQHMRWKKYRRMYSNEVKALLHAQNPGMSPDLLTTPKKTSDVSKIKGWKRKSASLQETPANTNQIHFFYTPDVNFNDSKYDTNIICNQNFVNGVNESISPTDIDLSPHSKRRQGFSHQKAHKQLFKELKMDWQDRMIHRKLGGWSLKGNRPQAFSTAAKKRQEKKSRETDALTLEIKDIATETNFFEENEVDATESKGQGDGQKKKKMIKIIYPLLTEKMVRNALKTLETGDIQRELRKKKRSRQSMSLLPDLTPVICKIEHGSFSAETPNTVISEAADFGSSPARSCSTPLASQNITPLVSSSASSTTAPLEIEFQEEPVMEGVDVASENMSSPSITDTSSLKSCSKPGCRYGCICHLCSVSETLAPLPSPVTKQQTPVCDKEYCRLGCICDSIDPEKPILGKTHCRKPSCMLQCVCSESVSFDGNEDIPYLPSMRRRPKPGERFSNLPQRERTHRSAKNLDAVTRKAMMLYETSEIYCERVERVRKRAEICSSPPTTSFDSTSQNSTILSVPNMSAACSTFSFDIDIVSEPSDDSSFQADAMFSFENSSVSEATTLAPSYQISSHQVANSGSQNQYCTRQNTPRIPRPAFILDDVRQTVPIVEPSAHKRKRKSHPLSDEIFISSTCARTQPFKQNASKDVNLTAADEEVGNVIEDVIEISPPASTESKLALLLTPSVSSKSPDLKLTETDGENKQAIPKITAVQTLTSEQSTYLQHWENTDSEVPVSLPASVSRKRIRSSPTNQHTSPNSVNNDDSNGHQRQHYGWHRSMVCLKARAPPLSQDPGEEDVKEEDEVKLLEFLANCNWEGAKREILAKVAQCLTRGQYPQPRTMNVCEFVVEILPKAVQPSSIPPELRAKLPGQMYSVRVRITRRESVIKAEDDADIIDLSGASPVKLGKNIDSCDTSFKSVARSLTEPLSSAEHKPAATTTDSTFLTSSSFGISGLSKLFITSPPVTGQPNQNLGSSSQNINVAVTKPVSAPSSRRSSVESTSVITFSDDRKQTVDQPVFPVQALTTPSVKLKGSSFMRLGSKTSSASVSSGASGSSGASVKTVTSTVASNLKQISSTASTKSSAKSLNLKTSNHPLIAKAVSSNVAPIFGPFSAKDVKYMIPGKDGTMQLIDVGQAVDKNKKLIAVPITLSKTSVDLKGKQGTVVALPVSGTGQNKMVSFLNSQSVPNQLKGAPAQQIVLRLPTTSHTSVLSPVVSSVRHPVVLQPLQSTVRGQPPRFQVVPVQISSCVAVSQNKVMSSKTAQGSKPTVITPKPNNNSDEMIMVFDAAHIKASHPGNSSSLLQTSNSTVDKGHQTKGLDHFPSAKTTKSGLALSSDADTSMLHTQLNGTIDLTVEKSPIEDLQTVLKNTSRDVDSSDENGNSDNVVSDLLENKVVSADVNGISLHGCSVKPDTDSVSNSLKENEFCSSQTKLQQEECSEVGQCSVATEASINNTCSVILSLKHKNLNESALVTEITPSENPTANTTVISSGTNSSPFSLLTSDILARESMSKTIQESVLNGTKRHLPASAAQENPLSPCPKKPCLVPENSVIFDEDSVTSMNSILGVQVATASPLSCFDRPKSVMSGALSTGSSDDLLMMLSSEEDIDVGEDEKPDDLISHRARAERALENDHASMYTKVDQTDSWHHSYMKKTNLTEEKVKSKGRQQEDRDVSKCDDKEPMKVALRNLQKVKHHNQLERLRRSRMRILFDELQQHVIRERGLPKDHPMSKVKVLSEAKKAVLQLNKSVQQGDELVKHYERINKMLLQKLNELKVNMLQQNVSEEMLNSILKEASKKYSVNSIDTQMADGQEDEFAHSQLPDVSQPIVLEIDIDENQEMVNLVSPSTEDKTSDRPDVSTPVYEDISDPEDLPAPKYEEISEGEEKTVKQILISPSSDG